MRCVISPCRSGQKGGRGKHDEEQPSSSPAGTSISSPSSTPCNRGCAAGTTDDMCCARSVHSLPLCPSLYCRDHPDPHHSILPCSTHPNPRVLSSLFSHNSGLCSSATGRPLGQLLLICLLLWLLLRPVTQRQGREMGVKGLREEFRMPRALASPAWAARDSSAGAPPRATEQSLLVQVPSAVLRL